MNHLKWMGHTSTIMEIQKTLHNDPQTCEVTLVAKGKSVRAHRFVLSSSSDLLRNLLADVPFDREATIIVPEIKGELLDSVLSFIYMGETHVGSAYLSEFLETMNILGVKSAISFECNQANLHTSVGAEILQVKNLTDVQMEHCDLVEQDNYAQKVDETQNVADPGPPRELEFLDVYHEPNHKITYSIEHIQGANNGEFILTGENGTFALAQNQDIDTGNGENTEKIDTEEDVEGNIIEEYNNAENPLISTKMHNIPRSSGSIESQSSVVQIMPKGKMYKVKADVDPIQMEQTVASTTDAVADKPIAKTEVRRSAESLIDLAVQAVIEEGMSLQKAAVKYELSKTVLWRRVRLHPNYMKTARENPQIKLVHERLKTGESLKSISHDLDIPMSTLHRYKVRLSQQGRLPDFIVCKKRDPGTREELREKLAKAVYACIHQGVSQNHAANLFDIPKSTLWRHLQKRALKSEQDQGDSSDVKEEIILS